MTSPCQKCHTPPPLPKGKGTARKLAIVGLPNTGKSTFFNRLTGLSQRVGNWPGLTVDLARARILLGGRMVEVVDLPGINDLSSYSEDEEVVRKVLADTPFDALVVVTNGAQLERQWRLVLQLKALGLPVLVLVNMADEMKQFGITLDEAALAQRLDAPVVRMSARKGDNWVSVLAHLTALETMADKEGAPHRADFNALAATGSLDKVATEMLDTVYRVPPILPPALTQRVDHYLMHPWFGLPIFFLMMGLLFQATYEIGKPLQTLMGAGLDGLRDYSLRPLIAPLPAIVQSLLVDGVWSGVSTVLTFVPILFVFFTLMALVEDSGYLARAAFLMDALMARLGLDGRSFVMHLMGFGCNVPAIMGTRIMRERNMRLLSMLTIPFSLCSARLQVFLFFSAALFSPHVAPWVLLSLYVMSFAAAILTAWLFRSRFRSDELFVMEVPPYRLPGIRHMTNRAVGEVRGFLHLASTFILLGVVLVWVLTHIPAGSYPTLADALGALMAPVLDPIGIKHELSVALLFGFVAKEILLGSMAVIYNVPESGLGAVVTAQLDWVSAYSFMLFTLIYVPCLSTIAAIRKESKSTGFAVFSTLWSLLLAWCVSAVFYQGTRWLQG